MTLGLLQYCRRSFLSLSKAILPIGFTNVRNASSHEGFQVEELTLALIIVSRNAILTAIFVGIWAHSSPCDDFADIEQIFGTFVDLGLSCPVL